MLKAMQSAIAEAIEVEDAAKQLLDDAAERCVRDLLDWARAAAPRKGVQIASARLRRWQSIEEPEWLRLVVDLTLAADPPAALRFWDRASEKLADLVEAHPSAAGELLTVRAHWR